MHPNKRQGEVSMGMKSNTTSNNRGWKRSAGFVLIFTMLFSIFMYQGLLNPGKAEAAVGYGASSESHTGTTGSTNQASF